MHFRGEFTHFRGEFMHLPRPETRINSRFAGLKFKVSLLKYLKVL